MPARAQPGAGEVRVAPFLGDSDYSSSCVMPVTEEENAPGWAEAVARRRAASSEDAHRPRTPVCLCVTGVPVRSEGNKDRHAPDRFF